MNNTKKMRAAYDTLTEELPIGSTIEFHAHGQTRSVEKTNDGWESVANGTLLKPGMLAAGMVGSIRHTITAGTSF